jgi:type IV secretory pathway protease TraF
MVFLAGDHPDSFDSRYFGFVDKKVLRAWARPIW